MKGEGQNSDNFPVKLARKTLEEYLRQGRKINLPPDIPDKFKIKAGAFVSLYKKGKLRGCIGTFLPTKKNVAEEIIHNAISAATKDPRFSPVTQEELKDIHISVDILSKPEPVTSLEQLNPKKYGVIVSRGWQKGLLLPDLKGVDTVKEQLEIAKQKAGLLTVSPEELEIQRFTVKRYKE
ncbi:AmmeMemoRadiSam system protein A [Candidatus Aerophobetes bacterium]|nr:AmmeMemoRadiSam system protein A [Candidatus Aerophobetes bacterium]